MADTKIYQLLKNYNGTFNNLNLTFYSIKKLPDNIRIRNDLNLEFSDIKKLPDNLYVGDTLDISKTKIKSLPAGLKVGKCILLYDTKISKLPNNLKLSHGINLKNTAIKSLPENMDVRWLRLSLNKIKNITYRKNCTSKKKTIFAAYLHEEFKIFMNEFLIGNLEQFEQYADKEFYKPEASELKQAASDCVAQLQQKLSVK
ncbi:hypothetical protein [Snodgrassella communis]|uniref:hypothetical protein n=1 Tax=Snodgrassella communis TaxID=2946699 RepID=UPI001185F04B|nr:hypothetical protein [Snodgrassella communis]